RLNENLLVKRLQLIPGGIVNVISANEAYPTFEIDLKNPTDDVAIIGRVEWFGRSI
ncbi:S24 family peptidase, partial [Neisseria sp. P0016.S002]